ncbi:hypothetical protein IZY60_03660 [Lutibacter sp. B2]|nr:hypothetical protein [Lutibacter sp. B2]
MNITIMAVIMVIAGILIGGGISYLITAKKAKKRKQQFQNEKKEKKNKKKKK